LKEPFVLNNDKRYKQKNPNPKISINSATYKRLQNLANSTGLSISRIAIKAINYALDNLE
jgi:hypothetical protein